jgi:uncharacterized protein with GYD domain
VPKYLIKVSYTDEGAGGLLKDGGSKRRDVAEQALKTAGGKMEAFYFAFGDTDAFMIVDAPNHATVLAASLTLNASGAVRTKTVILLTPEEVDQAAQKSVTYRAPGQPE